MEKPVMSPTTEASLVFTLDPASPHHTSMEPVPPKNCENRVWLGSALIWSGGSDGSESMTS